MFFKTKPKQKVEKSVGATLYPTSIIIETRNKKDEFTWYSTDEVSILHFDAPGHLIEQTIDKHLSSSRQLDVPFEEIKRLRDSFKKLTKLKTDKAVQQDAKYVSIYLAHGQLRFEPFRNKVQQKSFYRMPENIFSVELTEDLSGVANSLRKAWDLCTIE